MNISGTYTLKKWEENPYETIDTKKHLTKAIAEFVFSGDIEAMAKAEFLMCYTLFKANQPHQSIGQYVGLMRLEGKLQGKAGSFVLQDIGIYEAGTAKSKLSVVAGSGTGELSNILGSGSYEMNQNGCKWELNVSL